MKTVILAASFFAFSIIGCHCQESERQRNNLVFYELLGAAEEGAGIGYERYFQLNKLFWYSLRGGLSYNPEYKYVPPFMGNSLMFGKRHNVELGLNFMIKYPENNDVLNPDFNVEKEIGSENYPSENIVERRNIFNFLLGYRYQNERNGFMARSFIGTPIKSKLSYFTFPHFGFSIGLSF